MEIGGGSSSKVGRSSKGFGEDVEIEILSRLPVKSLCRFLCVSNAWYALIKRNPSFTDLHLQRSDRNFSLVLKRKTVKNKKGVSGYEFAFAVSFVDDELKQKSLDLSLFLGRTLTEIHYVEVVGSSNGLVCLRLSEDYKDRTKFQIAVWNPATKQHRILPLVEFGVCLGFYQVCLGFEYFRDMRDYKVVSIIYEKSVNRFQAKVFTANTNCWTKIETCSPNPGLISYHAYDARTVNGVMYSSYTGNVGYPNWNYILSFDLRDEVFQVTPVPEDTCRISPLLSLKGSLAFVAKVRWTRPYETKRHDQAHLELLTISTGRPRAKQLQVAHRWSETMTYPPYLILKDEYLLTRAYGSNRDEYTLYDLRSHEMTELPQHKFSSKYDYITAHNYTESLVSVGI